MRGYEGAPAHVDPPPLPEPKSTGHGLQLICYKPLFSGPAVERVPELQFQRPQPEIVVARADARATGVAGGDLVRVSANGHSVELRVRLSKSLRSGVALIANEHASGLSGRISVALSTPQEAKAQ